MILKVPATRMDENATRMDENATRMDESEIAFSPALCLCLRAFFGGFLG